MSEESESDSFLLVIVYLWCGLLSGVWVILAICILYLWVRVRRLIRVVNRRPSMYLNNPRAISTKPSSNYSYGNPSVVSGEELARRGYTEHAPNRSYPQAPDITSHSSSLTPGGVPPPPRMPPLRFSSQGRDNSNFIY